MSAAFYDNVCCERGLCIVCPALQSWLVLADAEVAVCVASRINDRALTAVCLRKLWGLQLSKGIEICEQGEAKAQIPSQLAQRSKLAMEPAARTEHTLVL